MDKIRWTNQELEYLKTHYLSNPSDIAKFLNRSEKAIKNKAQRIGIARIKQPSVDHKYFSIPNEDNCYWAGFIAADGNLPLERYQIIINLAPRDKKHLNKLKNCINLDREISEGQYGDSAYVRLLIPSYNMYQDLQNNFNITAKKSLTLNPPRLFNEDLIRAFIRGYFDGDGCLSSAISFAGTRQFLEWIRLQLSLYIDRSLEQNIRLVGNICILEYGGRIQKGVILDWLYKDSKSNTRLERKYNKYYGGALLA